MAGSGGKKRGASGAKRGGAKRSSGKPAARPRAKPRAARKPAPNDDSFTEAFAALLKRRKILVPAGLLDAPRDAYASQPAAFVERLADLSDADLKVYAAKIAGYASRQEERARADWEASPLVVELRRRGLREPSPPARRVGASVSLARPVKEWSDAELVRTAEEWSRLGQS